VDDDASDVTEYLEACADDGSVFCRGIDAAAMAKDQKDHQ
jgi:hypothetical protein